MSAKSIQHADRLTIILRIRPLWLFFAHFYECLMSAWRTSGWIAANVGISRSLIHFSGRPHFPDIGQVPVSLGVVDAVADNELIGDLESRRCPPRRANSFGAKSTLTQSAANGYFEPGAAIRN